MPEISYQIDDCRPDSICYDFALFVDEGGLSKGWERETTAWNIRFHSKSHTVEIVRQSPFISSVLLILYHPRNPEHKPRLRCRVDLDVAHPDGIAHWEAWATVAGTKMSFASVRLRQISTELDHPEFGNNIELFTEWPSSPIDAVNFDLMFEAIEKCISGLFEG